MNDETSKAMQEATNAASVKARHRLGGWFRDRRWFARSDDPRPYFEATAFFQARDLAQAEFLFDAMIDGLGCGNLCGDQPCPHFRFGALHQMDDDG